MYVYLLKKTNWLMPAETVNVFSTYELCDSAADIMNSRQTDYIYVTVAYKVYGEQVYKEGF